MSQSPLQSFSDFDFTFDPSLSNIFPTPPPLPPSADLFSPAETTDLLGFLDAFGDFNWGDFQTVDPNANAELPSYNEYVHAQQSNGCIAPYSNPHLHTAPEPSTRPKSNSALGATRSTRRNSALADDRQVSQARSTRSTAAAASDRSSPIGSSPFPTALPPPVLLSSSSSSASSSAHHTQYPVRSKPLLSTPQKRLNHIMSEQKRRNAIRDGYAQLISLLSPAGSAPGIGMPTRGRPKGSGSRGKGQSKGKSGVLFRAVEYCRWLEEGRDALREEVLRLEAAAGIRYH